MTYNRLIDTCQDDCVLYKEKISMSKILLLLVVWVLVSGCNPVVGTVVPTIAPPEPSPAQTTQIATLSPTESRAPVSTTTPSPSIAAELPEEAILILEPGAGSRLVDSIHLAGIAGPTFESHLLVQVVLDDGSELISLPITIQAEMGSRGQFAVDIPFSVQEIRQAFILVSSDSASIRSSSPAADCSNFFQCPRLNMKRLFSQPNFRSGSHCGLPAPSRCHLPK